jgi:hypothetical protein
VALRTFANRADRWAGPGRRRWIGNRVPEIGPILVVVTRWYSEVSVVCDVKVFLEVDSVLFADVCLNTHLGPGPNPSWAGCQIQSFTRGGSRPLGPLPSAATGA